MTPTTTASPLRPQLGVIKAAVLLMGLSLGLASPAANAADSADNAGKQRVESRHSDFRDGRNRLEALHKDLALTGDQEALWQSARDASEKLRQDPNLRPAFPEALKKARDTKTPPDLRALAAEADKLHDAREKAHKPVREAWLKFYDALNPDQKQKASHFLLAELRLFPHPGPFGRDFRPEHSRHDGRDAPPPGGDAPPQPPRP